MVAVAVTVTAAVSGAAGCEADNEDKEVAEQEVRDAEEEDGSGGNAGGAEWSRQISRIVLSPCRSADANRFRRTFSSNFVPSNIRR